jgi:hypothetical protein
MRHVEETGNTANLMKEDCKNGQSMMVRGQRAIKSGKYAVTHADRIDGAGETWNSFQQRQKRANDVVFSQLGKIGAPASGG